MQVYFFFFSESAFKSIFMSVSLRTPTAPRNAFLTSSFGLGTVLPLETDLGDAFLAVLWGGLLFDLPLYLPFFIVGIGISVFSVKSFCKWISQLIILQRFVCKAKTLE
jgi:hypothetical protein